MDGAPRYEIVDTIASGDFAVVYRARDRELGREVAVKQIHQQFLADPRQLARYWQEAQLLASLQHPNILTIYDVVRPKGWLILELMRGSLQPATQSDGIDLDFLRIALAGCLSALGFLHQNGVIHGDIKPSNLLVDPQGRVKLGDFGLARRASNEGGSLLKGTTKYMAPELVSDQFGGVGPASDLYSLGFTAYELMCGKQFDTLFPGLSTFGRDKQIAWMMWHAAADRNLPPINRVLEGVPEDLARVIQHLVAKDPARRCQSAKEALWELRVDPLAAAAAQGPSEAEAAAEAAAAEAAKRKRRRRFAAVVAVALWAALFAVISWRLRTPPPKPAGPPEPVHAVVSHVYPDEWLLAIRRDKDGKADEIELNRYARIFINDKSQLLRDLQPHDQIVVTQTHDESGHRISEIRAFRPETDVGHVKALKPQERRLTLVIDKGENSGKELTVSVPPALAISLNGQPQLAGQPVKLADLRPDDRVTVHHLGKDTGREATELAVERLVTAEGKITELQTDDAKKEPLLTVDVGTDDKPQLLALPFAPECEITLDGRRRVNNQVLKPADLRVGDKVKVAHDSRAVRIDANRALEVSGALEAVHDDAKSIDVAQEGGQPVTCLVGPKCKITLGGRPAQLADLHRGDLVEVTHESPGMASPEALSVAARRPADKTRWAILIGVQDYEDRSLSRLEHTAADAKLLHDALVDWYKVPADQAVLFSDESQVRLEQAIPAVLGRITAEDKLLVYFTGHAYRAEDGRVYLAPKNFDLRRMPSAGLPLQWLVDALEKCPAGEKLLLLDCSHAAVGADLAQEPSPAEMLRGLPAPPGRSALRTVTAIASCKAAEHSADWPEKQHGLFAWLLAQGYAGTADANRDGRIEPTELFDYLRGAMAAAAGQLKTAQTPELFLPDNRPPRLSDDAKAAIRRLAGYLGQDKLDMQEAQKEYDAAADAAGKEPEPKLLWGLLLLKDKRRDAALKRFDQLRLEQPTWLPPLMGIAWARFDRPDRKAYQAGVDELAELVAAIPAPKKPGQPYPDALEQTFFWIGQLRDFAAVAAEPRPSAPSLDALDAAVVRHGPDAQRFYEQGQAKSRKIADDFDRQIAAATTEADAARLKVERRRLVHYVDFPFDRTAREILAGLDQ